MSKNLTPVIRKSKHKERSLKLEINFPFSDGHLTDEEVYQFLLYIEKYYETIKETE